MSIDENLRWILSFYRTSEINGALFFGQLARALRPSPIQRDMTHHFADEAQHARYWTECLETLGAQPLKLGLTYQDEYLSAAGMPANLMEVLAITQVFEKRVISQYALHSRIPDLNTTVQDTLKKIMVDEKWHLQWIHDALKAMESDYGADNIKETLRRFTEADRDVYKKITREHEDRIDHLMLAKK